MLLKSRTFSDQKTEYDNPQLASKIQVNCYLNEGKVKIHNNIVQHIQKFILEILNTTSLSISSRNSIFSSGKTISIVYVSIKSILVSGRNSAR